MNKTYFYYIMYDCLCFRTFLYFINVIKCAASTSGYQHVTHKNELDIIKQFEEIKESLIKFNTLNQELKDEINVDYYPFKVNPAIYFKNLEYFRDAQKKIIILSNQLNPTAILKKHVVEQQITIYSDEIDNDAQMILLSFVNEFMDILRLIYDLYLTLNLEKIFLLETKIDEECIGSLALLLNNVHEIYYSIVKNQLKIEKFIKYQTRNGNKIKSEIETNKLQTLDALAEINYYIFTKLLILLYEHQVNIQSDNNNISLANPLTIGFNVLKETEHLTYKIDRILAKLLNVLLIKFLNHTGLHSADELIFFDGDEIIIVEYADIYLLYFDGQDKTNDFFITDISNLYETPSKGLVIFYFMLHNELRSKFISLIFNFILLNFEMANFDKIKVMWEFTCSQFYSLYVDSIDFQIFELIMREIIQLSEKNILFSILSTFKIWLQGLMELCKISNTFGASKVALEFIENCLVIFDFDDNIDKTLVITRKWKSITYILTTISKINDNSPIFKAFFDILSEILRRLLIETFILCESDINQENYRLIRVETDGFFVSLATVINSNSLKLIVLYLERMLCSSNPSIITPMENYIFEHLVDRLFNFLDIFKQERSNYHARYIKRISNIILKHFMTLLDLNVTLQNKPELNEIWQIFEKIIDYLFERNFNELKFTHITNTLEIPKITKDRSRKSINYSSTMDIILVCNTAFYKKKNEIIDNLINNLLQISLCSFDDFQNIVESFAYYFLNEAKIANQSCLIHGAFSISKEIEDKKKINIQASLLDDEIAKCITSRPQNTYKTLLNVFVKFMCFVRSFKCKNEICVALLQKMTKEINSFKYRLYEFDQSIENKFKPEDCVIFYDFENALQQLNLLNSGILAKTSNFIAFLLPDIFPMLAILYNLFVVKSKYEQSFEIALYFIKMAYKYSELHFTQFSSFEKMNLSLKKSGPEIFTSMNNKDENTLLWINIIFYQLLCYFKINLQVKMHFIQYISLIKAYAKESNVNNIVFKVCYPPRHDLNAESHDIRCLRRKDFIDILLHFVQDQPNIYKYILCACIHKLELTTDFCEFNLSLCYTLFYELYSSVNNECVVEMNFDNLFSRHIANAISRENFEMLCKILGIHIKKEKAKKINFTAEYLQSKEYAVSVCERMGWPLDIIDQ